MEENRSRVTVSFNEGRLEIEGPESFVEKQVDRFATLIEAGFGKVLRQAPAKTPNDDTGNSGKGNPTALSKYENLFDMAGDKVKILADLPGSTKADQSVNAALLLTLGYALLGTESTAFEEIRETCQHHGCLDSKHFAETLKAEKDAFVFEGTPKKQTARLTVPGRRRAETLAAQLNQPSVPPTE